MPTRLPVSCVTLNLLASLVLSSSVLSVSLSASLVFAGLAGFAGLAVFVFLVGAAAGGGAGGGAGTISAMTFCRRIAITGQSGDLPTVVGTIARSAPRLLKACALALALSVATSTSLSRSWFLA